MRSRRLTGFRAFEWGIATDCVADADLEKATDALVDELRSFAPLAQRTAKKLMKRPRGCQPVARHRARRPGLWKAARFR